MHHPHTREHTCAQGKQVTGNLSAAGALAPNNYTYWIPPPPPLNAAVPPPPPASPGVQGINVSSPKPESSSAMSFTSMH